jgi:hypothetical protein
MAETQHGNPITSTKAMGSPQGQELNLVTVSNDLDTSLPNMASNS